MGKLALYSDQIIPENSKVDQRLLNLIGKQHSTMGYIPSSSDPDRIFYTQQQSYYDILGIDLSTYFEIDVVYEPNKLNKLLACNSIHLSGGNTYHFLYWLRERGLIDPIRDFVANGGILVGASAGSILMTPEISISSIFDDHPMAGETMTDLTALGLVGFVFLPHLNKVAYAISVMKEYSRKYGTVVYGCQDGDGIIVNGGEIECIGDIKKVINGVIE